MDDGNITEIELEIIIHQAIGGDKQALNLLVCSKWFNDRLDSIAAWAWWQFNVRSEAVRDFVFDKVYTKITEIENNDGIAWRGCLTGWCYRIAINFCLNELRHRGVENDYRNGVIGESTQCRRRSKEGGWNVVASGIARTPEDELVEKREILSQEQRRLELRAKARNAINSLLAPEKRDVGNLWLDGRSPGEIIQKTGWPSSSVYRVIKDEVIPIVIDATKTTDLFENAPERIKVLQRLLANSLLETAGQETAPRKARA
jgi:DNA-directed RNA polymerase specialized sigma24 family protein